MSLNLNKVLLSGRLTADPELKVTPAGVSMTTFTLAVDRDTYKDNPKTTDFLTVVAWRQTAEFITRFFRKGSPLFIAGKIQTRSWDDGKGNKRFATEIVADEAKFVESKLTSDSNISSVPTASAPVPQPELMELDDEELPF